MITASPWWFWCFFSESKESVEVKNPVNTNSIKSWTNAWTSRLVGGFSPPIWKNMRVRQTGSFPHISGWNHHLEGETVGETAPMNRISKLWWTKSPTSLSWEISHLQVFFKDLLQLEFCHPNHPKFCTSHAANGFTLILFQVSHVGFQGCVFLEVEKRMNLF